MIFEPMAQNTNTKLHHDIVAFIIFESRVFFCCFYVGRFYVGLVFEICLVSPW